MTELSERELNYTGLVDPPPGQLMGPGADGRIWSVVGAMYDTETDKTTVTVREVDPEVIGHG